MSEELKAGKNDVNLDKTLLRVLKSRDVELKYDYISFMQSTRKYNRAVVLVTIIMLVILPLITFFQYRWLGQLRDEEFRRMHENLGIAAFHYRSSVEREFAELAGAVFTTPAGTVPGSTREIRDRILQWKAITDHPDVVTDTVSVVPLPVSGDTAIIELDSRRSALLVGNFTGLVLAIPGRPGYGYIIPLNSGFVVTRFLPDLIRADFSSDFLKEYSVTIASAEGTPLVQSAPPEAGETGMKAEFTAPLFRRFHRLPPFPHESVSHRQPMPPSEGGPFPGIEPGQPRNPNEGMSPIPPGSPDPGVVQSAGPQLRIIHRNGSLESLVNRTQWRNLGISAGILFILGGSVIFLLISAQRARRLAGQQLEFVAGISHELRTPLAVIKSAGENLADGIIRDPDQLQRYGGMIKNEVIRLSDMVEKAITYASIQSGRQTHESRSVDLRMLTKRVLDKIKRLYPENGCTIELGGDEHLPIVSANELQLESAIENLVLNAMKYNMNSRWIGIGLYAALEGKAVEITVRDHGIGIPPEDLAHIFEPFYRGKNAVDRQIKGSGLGLSITKHIVDSHHGSVTVRSSVNEGTVFTIRIPVA